MDTGIVSGQRNAIASALPAYIVARTAITNPEGSRPSEYPVVLQQLFEKYGYTPIGVGMMNCWKGPNSGGLIVVDQVFPTSRQPEPSGPTLSTSASGRSDAGTTVTFSAGPPRADPCVPMTIQR